MYCKGYWKVSYIAGGFIYIYLFMHVRALVRWYAMQEEGNWTNEFVANDGGRECRGRNAGIKIKTFATGGWNFTKRWGSERQKKKQGMNAAFAICFWSLVCLSLSLFSCSFAVSKKNLFLVLHMELLFFCSLAMDRVIGWTNLIWILVQMDRFYLPGSSISFIEFFTSVFRISFLLRHSVRRAFYFDKNSFVTMAHWASQEKNLIIYFLWFYIFIWFLQFYIYIYFKVSFCNWNNRFSIGPHNL